MTATASPAAMRCHPRSHADYVGRDTPQTSPRAT